MNQSASILILTSKTGGGHNSLATALQERLSPTYAVTIIDPQPGIFHTHYRLVSRYLPWLWRLEYKSSDTPARALQAQRWFAKLVQPPIVQLLRQVQPRLVISVYSSFGYAVREAIRTVDPTIHFVQQLSDPKNVHQSWLTIKEVSAVFAPTRETFQEAVATGFRPEQVLLTGWPIRQQFEAAADLNPAEIRRTLGLRADCFTLFVQGGGEGAARFANSVEAILTLNRDPAQPRLQVILATGSNEWLAQRFADRPNLAVLPFTTQIASFMAAADLVMGKAGPNTLFEAITLGKPFIATTYIPGQEEPNLGFIEEHQLGWVALDGAAQRARLQNLLDQPEQLRTVKSNITRYQQWNRAANETILPHTQRLLKVDG